MRVGYLLLCTILLGCEKHVSHTEVVTLTNIIAVAKTNLIDVDAPFQAATIQTLQHANDQYQSNFNNVVQSAERFSTNLEVALKELQNAQDQIRLLTIERDAALELYHNDEFVLRDASTQLYSLEYKAKYFQEQYEDLERRFRSLDSQWNNAKDLEKQLQNLKKQ